MKKVLLFIFMLFMPLFIKAEEINFNWFNNFGGTEDDYLVDLIEVDDGIFALGIINNDPSMMNNQELLLIKYDFNGKELWSKKIGGSDWDGEPGDLILTSDNNLVIWYHSWSIDIEGLTNKGELDFVVAKLDFDGNIIWQNNFGGNSEERITKFIETNDGGFVGVGDTWSSDLVLHPFNGEGTNSYIIKISSNGELLWFDTFGGDNYEQFYDVVELNDNSLIVSGRFSSTNISGVENKGGSDAILFRYDENGNKMWMKTWGGNGTDSISKICIYENREIFLVNFTDSTDVDGANTGDFFIMKYDIDGNMLVQNSFGSEFVDRLSYATLTKNGNLVIIGYYYKLKENGEINNNDEDSIIGYLDNDGNLLWKKIIGGNAKDYISGYFETENENIIFYGFLASTNIEGIENKGGQDAYIVKYDKQGNLLWQHTYGSDKSERFNLIKAEEDNFIVFGDDSIFEYDQNGNVIWHQNFENVNASLLDFTDYLILSNGDLVVGGFSEFTNLYNVLSNGKRDCVVFKYSIKRNIESLPTKNGKFEVSHNGNKGLIKPVPDGGYELDKIVVKDTANKEIEAIKQDDGSYTFNLYNDVSVEVLFKEIIENPKTGVSNIISLVFTFMLVLVSGLFVVRKYNKSYEL